MDSKAVNILIPMAGAGRRFAGYDKPKPLIDVLGKTMIQRVVDNIGDHNFIFVVNNSVINIGDLPRGIIVTINHTSEGPACTALLAEDLINNDTPLIIVNCDQIIRDFNMDHFLEFCEGLDGVLGCFISHSHKNSYIQIDSSGCVIDVKEKIVISNMATNGLHYWKKGSYFIDAAKRMIRANDRYNNEFYIAPTYNYMIKDGRTVKPYFFNLHFPIGTPEDLDLYIKKYGSAEY